MTELDTTNTSPAATAGKNYSMTLNKAFTIKARGRAME
jgi:hypothetical protein